MLTLVGRVATRAVEGVGVVAVPDTGGALAEDVAAFDTLEVNKIAVDVAVVEDILEGCVEVRRAVFGEVPDARLDFKSWDCCNISAIAGGIVASWGDCCDFGL